MIEIRWQRSDRSAGTAHHTSESSETSTPQASVANPPSTLGLSTGTKAAIGVVIPVTIIAAFFAALIFWRQYRKRQILRGGVDQIEIPEMHAECPALYSLEVESDVRSIHEVEGHVDRKELGGADIAGYERHELPANFP